MGIVAGWMLSIGVIPTTSHAEDDVRIRLGGQMLNVPQRYLEDGARPPIWLRWLPGLDDGSREILLTIDALEIQKSVPGYLPTAGNYKDNLRIFIAELTDEEAKRYRYSSALVEAISGTGSYSERIVNADSNYGLTRIYRKSEHPRAWQVFRSGYETTLQTKDVLPFFVGDCLAYGGANSPTPKLVLCKNFFIVDGFYVQYTTSEQNIHLVDQIREIVGGMVKKWRTGAVS